MSEPSAIPDHANVRPGDRIAGKYTVERVLGSGGMGTVIAVTHLDLQELRAIKLMHPMHLENAHAIERFLREARVISRLKSEHIPRLFDVGRLESGAPYMVMEVLQGQDLRHLIKERGPLPVHEAVQYMLQTCEAVAEAHASGIVHRDLKPANLFLTFRDDGRPCIKVLDFGISKLLEPMPEGTDMTKTLDVLGSLHYMAPEQLRSSRHVDPRADIWSLGVILYRLLTGRLPFQGDTPLGYIMALRGTAHPPRAFRSSLPPSLDAVVMRCLEKDPEKRTPNVQTLAAELLPFAMPAAHEHAAQAPVHPAAVPPPAPSLPAPASFPSESISVTQPMSDTLPSAHLIAGSTEPFPEPSRSAAAALPEAEITDDSLNLFSMGESNERARVSLPSTLDEAQGPPLTKNAVGWQPHGRPRMDSTEPLPPPASNPESQDGAIPEYYEGPSPLETIPLTAPLKQDPPATSGGAPRSITFTRGKKGISIPLFVAVGCMFGILIGLVIAIITVYFRPPPPSLISAVPTVETAKAAMPASTLPSPPESAAPASAPASAAPAPIASDLEDNSIEFFPAEPAPSAAAPPQPSIKKPIKPVAAPPEPTRKRPFD